MKDGVYIATYRYLPDENDVQNGRVLTVLVVDGKEYGFANPAMKVLPAHVKQARAGALKARFDTEKFDGMEWLNDLPEV